MQESLIWVEVHSRTILESTRYVSVQRESFKEELQRAGLQETQIFQVQLVEKSK